MTKATPTTKPHLSKGDVGTHLHILTIAENTVFHPQQGGDEITKWTRSSGERCEAKFDRDVPELDPAIKKDEVKNGARVEWINPTRANCQVLFCKDKVSRCPFEDGVCRYDIPAGTSQFSGPIAKNASGRYPYWVEFPTGSALKAQGVMGNPVIIIR